MAATIKVYEYNGTSPGTPTDKSAAAIRFKHADNATVDLNDPMVKPAAGSNYSRRKNITLFCTTKDTSTQISNIKWYWDGTFGAGTGITMYYRTTPGAYTEASADQDGTGEGSTFTDAAAKLVGAPLTVHAAACTLTDATRVPMNFLELYLKLGTTVVAPVVVSPAESFTFTWDEV